MAVTIAEITKLRKLSGAGMMDCKNLISVFIPDDSISTIDSYAFENCIKLRTINLPICVETVGDRAFANCKHLQCGLFIDNESSDFRKSLRTISKMPAKCFVSCDSICTHINSYFMSLAAFRSYVFISLIIH